MSSVTWQTAKRVLCVRLDSFGDVLMTGPAMDGLRDAVPGRTITLLTSPSGAAAGRLMPAFDDVIEFDAPWMKHSDTRADGTRDRAFVDQLASRGFDAACICTVYSQTPFPAALACLLADIPLRLAYARERTYQLLTHAVPETEPQDGVRHEVRRQLDLVATVGAPAHDRPIRVQFDEAARRQAREQLTAAGVDPSRPLVVVHPGASAPSRRYAPASFATVADELLDQGIQALVVGGESDRPVVEQMLVAARHDLQVLVGRLDTTQLAATLDMADVLVGNNSGPAHLAAAMGTPVASLYAMTNPQHTPWMVPHVVLQHDVPCRWCYASTCPERHHACLERVEPSRVVEAVRQLLHESYGSHGHQEPSTAAPTESVAITR